MSKLELRVLGPIQLSVDGVEVVLSSGKGAVLAALALLRDWPSDGADLADLIWDDPPDGARKALQNQVRRMRSQFGAELVETRGSTYVLGGDVEIRGVVELLESPGSWQLNSWRGTPYKDVVAVPQVVAVREQLATVCLDVLEERARTGQWDYEIRSFLARQRFDLAGRPVLARLLVHEGDQDTEGSSGSALARRVLLSRAQEALLIAVTGLLGLSTPNQARHAIVVSGPAGSGKTTLLAALQTDIAEDRIVLSATCSQSPAAANETISALLDGLPPIKETNEQLQINDRFVRTMERLEAPVTLILDDAQWATVGIFDLFEKLARVPGIDVIFGTRDPQALIDGLPGYTVEIYDAPSLDQTAIEVLLAESCDPSVTAEDVQGVAAEIHFLTGGAPLFSVELIHELSMAHAFDSDGGLLRLKRDHNVPPSLLDVITDQVDSLPQLSRNFVELVATLHLIGGATTTAHLRDYSEHVTDETQRVGLVKRGGDGTWIMHAEVARAIYEALSPGACAELHAFACELLRGPAPLGAARHAMRTSAIPARLSLEIVSEAADYAFALSDYPAALEMWTECTRLAKLLKLNLSDQLDLVTRRCEAARRAGDPGQMEIMSELVQLATDSGDLSRRTEAVCVICKLGASSDVEANIEFVEFVENTLTLNLQPKDRAAVLVSTTQLYALNRFEIVRQRFDEAYKIAQELNDGELTRFVLPGAYMSITGPNDMDTRQRISHELLAQSLKDGDDNAEWEAHHLLFSCAIVRGDSHLMRHHAAAASMLPGSKAEPNKAAAIAYMTAAEHHLVGDLDRAEREADRCLDLSHAVGAQRGLAVYGALIMAIRHDQGRLGEMQPVAEMLHQTQPGIPGWKGVLAWVLSETGQAEMAHQLLSELAASGLHSLPPDVGHTAVLWASAMAAATTRDRDLCDEFARVLSPYAHQMSWTATCSLGPIDLALGRLATATGRIDEATELLDSAEILGAKNDWPAIEMRAQLARAEIDLDAPASQQILRSVFARATQLQLGGVAQLARRFRRG